MNLNYALLCLLLLLTASINSQEIRIEKADLPISSSQINALEFRSGAVWVCTENGIAKGGMNGFESVLTDVPANCLVFDQAGAKWVGTSDGELIKLGKDGSKTSITLPDSLINQDQKITSVSISGSKAWLGTSEGKIVGVNVLNADFEHIPSYYKGDVNKIIMENGRAKLVGRGNGLFISPKKYDKWFEYKNITQVSEIHKTGGTYWLIGKNENKQSILISSKDLFDWENVPFSCRGIKTSGANFNDMFFDQSNNIWIASDKGIIKYDRGNRQCTLYGKTSFPNFNMGPVHSIVVENDSVIWAGNKNNGLYKITLIEQEPEIAAEMDEAAEEFEDFDRSNLTNIGDINCNDTLVLNELIFKPSTADFLNGIVAKAQMDILVQYLNENENNSVELMGHTDNISTNKDYLIELSEKRVNRVKKYLAEKGIKKSRIETRAYGGTKPLVKKGEENRDKNRRVEVFIRCKYGY